MEIDLHDPAFAELGKFADRIATPLESPTVKLTDMPACLDDLLGVVYALIFARQQGFVNRSSIPIEVDKVVVRAQDVAKGRVRVDGKWMAGFHFNSAIYRLAAVYDRVLRVVVCGGEKERVGSLRDKAKERYSGWNSDQLDRINEQVNTLKHRPPGVFEGRKAVYLDAMSALAELLNLIDLPHPHRAWRDAVPLAMRTPNRPIVIP